MPPKIIRLPSDLYPFRLSGLPQFHYGQYTLTNVFSRITKQQRQACVDLWTRNGVLSQEQAWVRSAEVCYFITLTSSKKLIGVNTLYVGRVLSGGPQLYLNRMFIDPIYRNSRLMITGTAMMLCFAKTELEKNGMPGVVNINENRKLSRPGMGKIFSRLGYRKEGYQEGKEILYFEFEGIRIEECSKA